jgi:hypothetical protein
MIMQSWNWQAIPEEMEQYLETEKQREMFRLFRSGLSIRGAVKALGSAHTPVTEMRRRIKDKLLAVGYDPENGMLMVSPAPQVLKGRSAYVRRDPKTGNETTVGYWNKTDVSKQRQLEAILNAITSASEGMTPWKRIAQPVKTMADLCTVYTLTDFHLGMYSWADETGADWDMDIAENVLLNAVADMMEATPDSQTAVFAQLGDLLHWDGLLALTPTAKNVLDADTRFPLLVQTAIRVLIRAVEMLCQKHKYVHVIMAEGNHDIASSVWLRAIMTAMFRKNPRVTVDNSAFPFYHHVHGDVFIGWHHGHLQKMDNLPMLFATDPKFKSDYGKCKHTYIHTGHMHHQRVIEKGGIFVEQHPTVAARDAHGARGYLYSNRATKAITYHKEKGEVSRVTVVPNLKVVV